MKRVVFVRRIKIDRVKELEYTLSREHNSYTFEGAELVGDREVERVSIPDVTSDRLRAVTLFELIVNYRVCICTLCDVICDLIC